MPLPCVYSRPAILLVDDDPDIREAVACGLADTYTVHAVATGVEACGRLCAHPIAAILLDVFLDGERGLDCVPRFRVLSAAPIVILTGRGSEEVAADALRARAVDYLTKPFTLTALRTAVAQAIEPPPPRSEPPDTLTRVHQHLVTHLTGPHTAPSVAKDVGVSERHLRRLFQAACGHTVGRHLTLLRLRHAAELLQQSRLAIKEVMQAVGYPNLTTFGRAFKHTYGFTPSAFRRRAREGGSQSAHRP